MWTISCQRNELPNSASQGLTSTASPPRSSKPPGLFIQALTAITNSEPVMPAITTGIPVSRWARGESRSQP